MKRPSKRSTPRRLPSTGRPHDAENVKNPLVIVESGNNRGATIASAGRSGSGEGNRLMRRDECMLTAAEFQQLAAVSAEME